MKTTSGIGKIKRVLKSSHLRSQRGISLIEVLISVVILASSSVLILQAFSRIAAIQQEVNDRAQAYYVLADKMVDIELAMAQKEEFEESERGRVRTDLWPIKWSVTAVPIEEQPLLQNIYVDISWLKGDTEHKVSVQTLALNTVPAQT